MNSPVSPNTQDDIETYVEEEISSADTSTEGKNNGKFVSIHRRNLDRITSDAAQNQQHTVPDGKLSPSTEQQWTQKTMNSIKEHISQKSPMEWLETFVPMAKWLKTYDWKNTLVKDVVAGCTVGVMIIPQSMSYAKLAGLPVEFGLYSALVPIYAYALFGSSRQLAVGPVALVSLLLSTGLSHLLESQGITPEDANYAQLYATMSVQVAFLVGVMYIAMGILRLGFVTIFLSHAVVSGFTTGASVIIGMSQVKHIFGYNLPKSDVLHKNIINIANGIDQFNYKTFLMGIGSILALVFLKNLGKSKPKYKWIGPAGPLLVTVITILLTWGLGLDEKGIAIVQTIPKGLPSLTINMWTPIVDFGKLMQVVVSITIVGFMESIAIAKQLASKHKYEVDSSLELIGLGMANFLGAMFNAYPVTGSFSRSAVNNETGAQSGISGVITATLVGIVLFFLTPIFEQLVRLTSGSDVHAVSIAFLIFTLASCSSGRSHYFRCVAFVGLAGGHVSLEGPQIRLRRLDGCLYGHNVLGSGNWTKHCRRSVFAARDLRVRLSEHMRAWKTARLNGLSQRQAISRSRAIRWNRDGQSRCTHLLCQYSERS